MVIYIYMHIFDGPDWQQKQGLSCALTTEINSQFGVVNLTALSFCTNKPQN